MILLGISLSAVRIGLFLLRSQYPSLFRKYDAIIAAYHDQGLIPFKTISFGKGVNFSAGLSFIRTSPDHGTGFDIAGKGMADHTSFTNAIKLGIELFKSRNNLV